ncbi:hypothetical protein [Alkaliphilus hydrothermalis]|uniref:Uncharacterized protein n=1 Tax=Alkaliphilus hydrothermalis TaxID=1482730 RepID=A0ABS2NNE1_9FIRM|nr:hypothetical protein [Alkaliphilus hydrothermalis]MBM7614467.1 hypothetical protein [Alkaliphilus hydrothermalis]
MNKEQDVKQVIDDLVFIKTAISKNSNIFKFMSITDILKTFILFSGLLIIALSSGIYFLIGKYGDFQGIPSGVKFIVYLILVVSVAAVGVFKTKTILGAAQHVNRDITVGKLFKEVYTSQSLVIMLPYIFSISMIIVFFVNNQHMEYIVPFLSIFFGLLCSSMVNIFHVKELLVLGSWLVLSGVIALLSMLSLHPLLIVNFTFGIGMLLMYVMILISSVAEKGEQ